MKQKIRCGAHYCEVCKRCIRPPRLRQTYIADWWTVCEECEPDVLTVTFQPREESLRTSFKIKHQDIPLLIKSLQNFKPGKEIMELYLAEGNVKDSQ